MKEETWKDIEGYEGLYQVSNLGRVKSLERTIIRNDGKSYHQKEHIMKEYKNKDGYLYVALSKKNIGVVNKNIHRLVAQAFLDWNNYKTTGTENKNNLKKLEVNHIDGNKENNNFTNLEICTKNYNQKEAFRLGLNVSQSKGKYGKENFKSKKVLQKDKNGIVIKEWYSIQEAQSQLKINNISKCCQNKNYYKTAGGYRWEYANE